MVAVLTGEVHSTGAVLTDEVHSMVAVLSDEGTVLWLFRLLRCAVWWPF